MHKSIITLYTNIRITQNLNLRKKISQYWLSAFWGVKHPIREDREVNAVYERMTSGVYEVRMSVKEKDVTLLEVKIAVPDAASAEAIAGRWDEKNTDIYRYLIENLF